MSDTGSGMRMRLLAGGAGLVILGGVVGVGGQALLTNASTAHAATNTTLQAGATTPGDPTGYCKIYETALVSKLGTTQAKLESANKDAIDAVIDQAVKDGKLTAAQATQAKQTISDNSTNVCDKLGKYINMAKDAGTKYGPALQGAQQAVLTAAASALHIADPATLRGDIDLGKTVQSLATAANVQLSVVNTAIINAVQTQLASAVTAGTITSAQSTQVLTMVTAQVNAGNYGIVGLGGFGDKGGFGGFGFGGNH